MSSNEYHFRTRWRLPGTPQEVFDILADIHALPRWWPSVYMGAEVLHPGGLDGRGAIVALYTKGWLPYTLRWTFEVTELEPNRRIRIEAVGNFTGFGEWLMTQDGDFVNVSFEWKVRAHKRLLKHFSVFFKPLVSANHQWAMRKGQESLHLEMARRRAKRAHEVLNIPPPAGPTFPHSWVRRFKERRARRAFVGRL